MEGKRIQAHNTKSAQPVTAKSNSSLKAKGDSVSSNLGKGSYGNKNSPSSFRASTNSLNSASGKSASKDPRSKVISSHEVHAGDPSTDEAKLEITDSAYNSHVTSAAIKLLLQKSTLRCRGDVDKQIATLQKRVNDNLDALEETKTKLSALYVLQEQNNLLVHHAEVCQACSNEPSFTKGKSFEELMLEINRIKNQLPCKNITIPETNSDMAGFQAATSQLLRSLECISTVYGADQIPIAQTAAQLHRIDSLKAAVEISKESVEAVSHKASESILNDAIIRTANLKLNNV